MVHVYTLHIDPERQNDWHLYVSLILASNFAARLAWRRQQLGGSGSSRRRQRLILIRGLALRALVCAARRCCDRLFGIRPCLRPSGLCQSYAHTAHSHSCLTESLLPILAENHICATRKRARQEPDGSEEVGIFSFTWSPPTQAIRLIDILFFLFVNGDHINVARACIATCYLS